MKNYTIVEILSQGDTTASEGNESTGYMHLFCAPKQASEFVVGDSKPCFHMIFENDQPLAFALIDKHKDSEENLAKIQLELEHRIYPTPVPYYSLDKEGVRRTYSSKEHKDHGKDVLCWEVNLSILRTENEETNDAMFEKAMRRTMTSLEKNGQLADMKDDNIMKYEDIFTKKLLAKAGVNFSDEVPEVTTE